MQNLNPYLTPILKELHHLLGMHSQVSEHQIIKHLQAIKIAPFDSLLLNHSKDLFSAHFLCMHALYHLKKQYEQEKKFSLLIQSVRIERIDFDDKSAQQSATQSLPETSDPLEAYYLNPKHYFETREDDINAMLKSFWKKYLAQDQKQAALSTLNLPPDADAKMIKTQYKRLAHKHHPDKGGSAEMFNKVREAKLMLDNSY